MFSSSTSPILCIRARYIVLERASRNKRKCFNVSRLRSFLTHQTPSITTTHISSRSFSSRRDDGTNNKFKVDALPFSISPEEALQRFHKWASDDQGLTWLLKPRSVRIGAAYAPVWSFDVNVRFVRTDEAGRRHFDWKPDIFSVYGNQSVVHLPGLAAYSGYSFRRSLINPVHNTTLVFMGDETVPFASWMMRDMVLSNGQHLSVVPDPWNTTRGRALSIIKEELQDIADSQSEQKVTVQTEIVSSRRVYMPTFVIDYKVLGVEYRAFVSGCDSGSEVSGFSHKVMSDEDYRAGSGVLARAFGGAQSVARNPRLLLILMQVFGNLIFKVLPRIPILGAISGVFVGFRKIVRPWLQSRTASAEWERQREHETLMMEEDLFDHTDEFTDNGTAARYFQSNRGRILRHLSGETEREHGDFNWYQEWEKWARQQYEQQQQQQQRTYTYREQQQQQQQQRQFRAKAKPKYQWDFDPNDPYSVLGIKRGATKSEVSAAFRKEMMKYHPDMQRDASEAEKARATERSKLISEAYRKIKSEMK